MRNGIKSFAAIVGAFFIFGCSTSGQTPKDNTTTSADACPATPQIVKTKCLGCYPLEERMYNALDITEIREDVKRFSKTCISGGLDLTAIGNSTLKSEFVSCVSKRIDLDPSYERTLEDLVQRAIEDVNIDDEKRWIQCRSNVNTCGQSNCVFLSLTESEISFDTRHFLNSFGIRNISDQSVQWEVANKPRGYDLVPESGSILPHEMTTVKVERVKDYAQKTSTFSIQRGSDEKHEITLKITDNSTQATLKPKLLKTLEKHNAEKPLEVAYGLVKGSSPSEYSESRQWMNTGDLLSDSGRFHDGILAYQEAQKLQPSIADNPEFISSMALAQMRLGKDDVAFQYFKKLSKNDKYKDVAISNMLAILVYRKIYSCSSGDGGDCEKAKLDLSRSLGSIASRSTLENVQRQLPALSSDLKSTYGEDVIRSMQEFLSRLLGKNK